MLTIGALSVAVVAAVAAPAGVAGATSSHAKTIKVSTAKVPNVGTVLTTASGLTLYRFTEDTPGTSKCTGACAKIWPPMLASKGAHVSGPRGVKGLAVTKVGNGQFQVTFHKIPLYRFDGDKKKGQANGQNVGNVWFAVLKSGIPATTAAARGGGTDLDHGACASDDTADHADGTDHADDTDHADPLERGIELELAHADAGHAGPAAPTPAAADDTAHDATHLTADDATNDGAAALRVLGPACERPASHPVGSGVRSGTGPSRVAVPAE